MTSLLRLIRTLALPAHALVLAVFASLAIMPGSAAWASSTSTQQGNPVMNNSPRVKLQTNKGDIVLQLDAEKAPKTVENFLSYVQEGFFDGTIFHRVINNFMIQGGGFEAGMKQKPTRDPI